MFHRVPFANGNGVVFEGIEVNGYAIGGTDFVLTAVTFADTCGSVVGRRELFDECAIYLVRFFGKLFLEGEYGDFERRESGVEA